MIRIAVAVGVVAVAATAHADTLEVRSMSTADSDVHDALPTARGLLVASSGGVERVTDGERSGPFTDGLPGVRARSLSAVDGGFWVGCVDGAALLDEKLAVVKTVPVRRVRRAVRWQGQTWFATYGDGLFRLDDGAAAQPRPVRLGRGHRNRLTDLAIVGDELWVASAGHGILRLGADKKLAGTIAREHGLPSNIVWQLVRDGDRVLVATAGGIAVIADGQVARRAPLAVRSTELPVRDVRSIAVGTSGAIHVATFGRGVFRFDDERSSPRRIGGTSAVRGRVVVAAANRVWVGHDRGLDRVDGERLVAVISGGLPSADITSLADAFGALWIGTFSDGLARRDPDGTITAVESPGVDPRINDLAAARDRLWIATDRGLWSYDGQRFARASGSGAPADVHVTALHVDAQGALWAASARTLARLDDDGWKAWTGDAETPVLALHAVTTDAAGRVWAGSLHGLLEFGADGTIRHHTVASGELAVDWVTSVDAVEGGGILAGTYHGGLAWVHDGKFTLEPERRGGLPAGWINPHAIYVDGSIAWLGTLDRGLVVGRKGGHWSQFTIADGLPGNDVTAVLDADHDGHGPSMWVGTRAGLVRVAIDGD